MRELDSKVAVIIGVGSAMARASVKLFAREGVKVVVADTSGADEDMAAEVDGDVLVVPCDVTKEADVEALVDAAMNEFDWVGAVLNEAGVFGGWAQWKRLYGRLQRLDTCSNRCHEVRRRRIWTEWDQSQRQPHEVAEVGAFLASGRASFVAGAVIPVDGGWSAKLA